MLNVNIVSIVGVVNKKKKKFLHSQSSHGTFTFQCTSVFKYTVLNFDCLQTILLRVHTWCRSNLLQ